jgi:alpha-tubulin suppressor-like RCC1 family protein
LFLDRGKVFVWGGNGESQLGLGDRTERFRPTPLDSLDGVTAIEVAASLSFSAILTGNP